ncbi:sugar ABC transporter ATP-binding protein [Mesorhizobium sp. KR9-304]|uniref:sugar ABC transporter ATP-binding protein n=1 Tax=Mesorhizobium sp. KR9-304 TaxID=3156614 RepID=UPI0032B4C701
MSGVLLDCIQIAKGFPGVQALKGVDFSLRRGEVHGLVGANGAGKSTLAKIIAGYERPDAGRMLLNGEAVAFRSPADALRRRIVTVHQDINLIPTLSVADNIRLNNELVHRHWGLIRRKETHASITELLDRYELDVSPNTLVAELTYDERKMVQIIKAASHELDVLLLDEPTAALTQGEVEIVLKLIRSLAKEGIGIIFISHYLNEIFAVCDRTTVLLDGARVAEYQQHSTSANEIVTAMLGQELVSDMQRPAPFTAEGVEAPALSVRKLSVPGRLVDISFDLGAGEILGVTGLSGSGASDLARAIFGAGGTRQTGEFFVSGTKASLRSPLDSLQRGVALLTNDRLREGILPDFSIVDNVCLPRLNEYATGPLQLLDRPAMRESGDMVVRQMKVRAVSAMSAMKSLSGGNQQKVLLGKWLATTPQVMLLDEPTIGIDIGAKHEIRNTIARIASGGVGVILFTSELDELVQLCHRVIVLFRGTIVEIFAGAAIDKQSLLHRSTAGKD